MIKDKFLVLIADDSDTDRALLKQAVGDHAPRLTVVGEVANGRETVAYLLGEGPYADRQQHPFPDLLVLDLLMPILDGFEVLDWLQTQNFPDLKVAILANVLTQFERQKILNFGVQHFYRKVVEPAELAETVKTLETELISARR